MSAKDTYHEAIKNALIKDGWTYIIYRILLKDVLPQSKVYLGISRSIYQSFFQQKAISKII